MISVQRVYGYSKTFLTCGIYDTIDALGGELVDPPEKGDDIECRLLIYRKVNIYRFIITPLPYGCLLQVQSENPDNSLSVETEERLLGTIFSNLEQLIEDAVCRSLSPLENTEQGG